MVLGIDGHSSNQVRNTMKFYIITGPRIIIMETTHLTNSGHTRYEQRKRSQTRGTPDNGMTIRSYGTMNNDFTRVLLLTGHLVHRVIFCEIYQSYRDGFLKSTGVCV